MSTVRCANQRVLVSSAGETGRILDLLSYVTWTGSASHLATPPWLASFLSLRLIIILGFITWMDFFILLVSLMMGYIKLDTYLLYICIKIMFLTFFKKLGCDKVPWRIVVKAEWGPMREGSTQYLAYIPSSLLSSLPPFIPPFLLPSFLLPFQFKSGESNQVVSPWDWQEFWEEDLGTALWIKQILAPSLSFCCDVIPPLTQSVTSVYS